MEVNWWVVAVGGCAGLALIWAVHLVREFSRLQRELADRTERDRQAFKALLMTLFKEAKARGDAGAARAVQMQGFACGIDVEKEAAWSRAS